MERYQGNLTIEEIEIGKDYNNLLINTMSTVISKTGNSIEMYNRTNDNSKGINCKSWYEISSFNRMFK